MQKIIMTFIFFLTISIANAQEITNLTKPMKCSEPQTVMNFFVEKHKEAPIWVGKSIHNSYITLLMNKETGSWTVIEYDDNVACVLGAGEAKTGSDPSSVLGTPI